MKEEITVLSALEALRDLHFAALGGGLGGYAESGLRDRVDYQLGLLAHGALQRPIPRTTDARSGREDK